MRAALPLLAAALIGGCTEAGDSRYPSLLPRAIESQSLAEPVRPAPVAAPDPALDARIAEMVARLDRANAGFVSAAQAAEATIAVARGVPEGSEAWLEAQAALTRVDAERMPVNAVLADLEDLAIARGTAGQPPYPALDAAMARADALAGEQAARVMGLEAALAGD